jgi:hypothetical protein
LTAPGVEYWSGHQNGWRYLAYRVDGQGPTGTLLEGELPLGGVRLTDVLSGPPQMQATISPRFSRLVAADGLPLLRPWRTAIYAEQDGIIRHGGLLVGSSYDGPSWALDVSGFTTYLKGTPYEGDQSFIETDPLVIARHMWSHVQAQSGSNLGVVLGTATSPVRVGKALVPDPATGVVPTESSGDDGPYRLVRWANDDLGQDFDDLASSTPFDYHERHEWDATKTQVRHYLDLGYPRLGRRYPGRFVLGENVQTVPTIEDDGDGFANDVRVLGAGEGSAMVIGRATAYDGGLRRVRTIDRKEITDRARADAYARQELARRTLMTTSPSVVVRSTPAAPLGAWGVGDEIRLQVDAGEGAWRGIDLWFRVVSMTVDPEAPEMMAMDLLRSDLVGAS